MIPFNFKYYKPDSIEEAISIYRELDSQGKKPIYYGGGTEFISMARMSNIYSEGVIDIKSIKECNSYEFKEDKLIIGSANTLRRIAELDKFPLLSKTVGRIADHTIQEKITLGGNLAGTIIYKESILPLLVSNSEVIVEGMKGRSSYPIMDLLNNGNKLSKGDLILNVVIHKNYLDSPYIHVKKTKYEKIDYPLITMVALKYNDEIRLAFSGLFEYPFRSLEIEGYLNDKALSTKKRIHKIINHISKDTSSDLHGSKDYRKFLLSTMLDELLEKFEKVS